MPLRVSHLRRGEIIAAVSAGVLVAVLFALPWFSAQPAARNGWDSLPVIRWLILVTAACGLLLAFFQETRRGPALPVVMSVIVTVLALVTTIVLIIRLPTSAGTPQVGAYLGVVGAAAMFAGGCWSMRQEDGWQPGPDRPIERVALPSTDPR